MSPARPELSKHYDPAEVEPRVIARDLATGTYRVAVNTTKPPFVISMPPPNITGAAHLGHGSTYTAMDVLTRYHRMRGENAVWLPGQDHAAIATEAVLVRELAKDGLTRDGLGREAYLERAWGWREQYGNRINDQFKRLGFEPDWDRERFTMDAGLSDAVVHAFVELYKSGLIYRGTRLVNWDPKAKSTLSDAEVENEPHAGSLWYVRYRAEDGGDGVVVATTRPETFFADVAVAVHPEDERYVALIGRNVILPITGRAIPVIGDAAVERDFGTGAVKVTPAHDATDYEIAQRWNATAPPEKRLPLATVINYDGILCTPVWRDPASMPLPGAAADAWAAADAAIAPFAGLERFEARKAVVAEIERTGALEKIEPHEGTVPVSSRSGAIIEPLLSLQWFCAMESLAKPALEAYRDGQLRFVPERFGRTYEHGLERLRDWNISRQVWWGHQLPVWYTPGDDVVVARNEEEAQAISRERFGHVNLRRDPDTLDTWFSSGLWPFSILGWPDTTPELEAWYPNQLMITGREIIFLWVTRMVMMGLHFVGKVPFSTVFITPLVFDLQGRKMSKSLGNAIDPMDLVAKYGADAVRFGILRQMRLESQELRFDEQKCEEASRFNNKLWNALKLLISFDEGLPAPIALPPLESLTMADRWILAKLHGAVDRVTSALDKYELGVMADALIDFGWLTFCDWYLDASKAESQRATRAAVGAFVFETFTRLMHPLSPFVSDEIRSVLQPDGSTMTSASWPNAANIPNDTAAEADFDRIVTAVGRLRNARSELGLAPRAKVTLDGPAFDIGVVELLRIFAGAELRSNGDATGSLAERLGRLRIQADPAMLRERYTRDVTRLVGEVERLEKKLGNEKFVANAKPGVVIAERAKLDDYRRELDQAKGGLAGLG